MVSLLTACKHLQAGAVYYRTRAESMRGSAVMVVPPTPTAWGKRRHSLWVIQLSCAVKCSCERILAF